MENKNMLNQKLQSKFLEFQKSDVFKEILNKYVNYVPTAEVRHKIKDNNIIPEINFIKEKIKDLEKNIKPKLDAFENKFLREHKNDLEFKDEETGMTFTEILADIVDKKQMLERNRAMWGNLAQNLTKVRMALLTGELDRNLYVLDGIRNAFITKEINKEFIKICIEDTEIKELIDSIVVDQKSITELSDLLITENIKFAQDAELQALFKNIKFIMMSMDILVRGFINDKLTKEFVEAETGDKTIRKEYYDKFEKIVFELKDALNVCEETKNVNETLFTIVKDFTAITDSFKKLITDGLDVDKLNLVKVDNELWKLLQELDTELYDRCNLKESQEVMKQIANNSIKEAAEQMIEADKQSRPGKIANAKRGNLWLANSIKLTALSLGEGPKSSEDLEYIKLSLLTLFVYASSVPYENFKACLNYTI